MKAGKAAGIIGIAMLIAGCAKADSVADYEAPDTSKLVDFSDWGTSGKLQFRIVKVEELKSLAVVNGEEKAPRAMRFFVVTLDVMSYDLGKGVIDFPARVSLVDETGLAYKPNSERFTRLNASPPQVNIDAGQFIERKIAFLVPKEYEPAALRCMGAEDAKPSLFALSRSL
ncbi:hypothetical protein GX441_10490 [bacterium]|nr:hypothetical protein [bacterium]